MNDFVHSEPHSGWTIEIYVDDLEESDPRTHDNFGTIVYSSTRYVLGDRRMPADDIEALTRDERVVWLPVYAYIHSGTCLSTTPFGDRFDSGRSGIIYADRDAVVAELSGYPEPSFDLNDQAALDAWITDRLRDEVRWFSLYLEGEVYGWRALDPDGSEIDGCSGFLCDHVPDRYADLIADAKGSIDAEIRRRWRAMEQENPTWR